MMKKELETLRIIEALPKPRHLFILPGWAEPAILDHLIHDGYLACQYHQRDENGLLHLVMDLQLTPKGEQLLHPPLGWSQLALKGSLAGASFMAMSLLILYLG
jgi:hypothetical protein